MSSEIPSYNRAALRLPGLSSVLIHTVLILGAVTMVVPFLWMVLTSLKTFGETTQVPPVIFPATPRWDNYSKVFTLLPFMDFYWNTVVMAFARTLGSLVFASMTAYAFARIPFKGRNLLFILLLSVMMVPEPVLLIPQYMIVSRLEWLNTMRALIAPGLFTAFGTFLLRQYFLSLPRDLEEAARLDGANHFQIYWHVMLPLVRSGLIALTMLKLLWSWNELIWPLIVINSPNKLPLAAGLAYLQDEFTTNFPLLMAGAVLAIAPMILMFMLLQRNFIEGVALSGTKA